jgi:histidine triad (HIT) family protein
LIPFQLGIVNKEDCIFCQIVQKRIPAFILHEDEKCLAFLDINPLAPGHTLIIPKEHAENIFDISEELLQHIAKIAQKLARKMREKVGAEGVNLFQASGSAAEQSIQHFHLHVIPRKSGDNLNINEWWRAKVGKMSKEQMEELARLLKLEIEVKEVKEEVKKEEEKERSKEEAYYIRRSLEIA